METNKLSLYSVVKWNGKIDVYQCDTCKEQMDNEDNMALHVLSHVEKSKQDETLEKLVENIIQKGHK